MYMYIEPLYDSQLSDLLAITEAILHKPNVIWQNVPVTMTFDLTIANIGHFDLEACTLPCQQVEFVAVLSEDSKWNPELDIPVTVPDSAQEGEVLNLRKL